MNVSVLRVLRVSHGLKTVDLARQAGGIHPDFLRRIEARLNVCPRKWQVPIASVFGLTPQDLFDNETGLAVKGGELS